MGRKAKYKLKHDGRAWYYLDQQNVKVVCFGGEDVPLDVAHCGRLRPDGGGYECNVCNMTGLLVSVLGSRSALCAHFAEKHGQVLLKDKPGSRYALCGR